MIATPDQLERILNCARTIQQIPSPTFSEEKRALYIQHLWQENELKDVTRDTAGNVYARLPGKDHKQFIVLSAHLDTVFPIETDLSIKATPSRMYGPGIGDNSMGLAGLTGLTWLLQQNKTVLPGDVWLVATVGEEGLGNLNGMRAVIDRFGASPGAYIILEGLGLGEIVHRGLSIHRLRVGIRTSGGHSWLDYGKPSAVHVITGIANRITGLQIPTEPRTTLNIGLIQGGISVNSIASSANMEIDLRSEESSTLSKVLTQVEELIRGCIHPDIQVSLETIGQRPGGQIPPDHPLVQLACQCLESIGMSPRLQIGSTDANVPLSLGIPAICIGITEGSGAHSLHEYVRTTTLAKGMEQLSQIVRRVWSAGIG